MEIFVWLAVAGLLLVVTSKRPVVGLAASAILWLCMPNIASPLLVGDSYGFQLHPAAWLTLVQVLVFTISSRRLIFLRTKQQYSRWWLALIPAMLVFALLSNYAAQGLQALALMVNLMIAPALWFLMAMLVVKSNRRLLRTFILVFLAGAAVNALVAIAQFLTQSVIFYGDYYVNEYWFRTDFTRAVGLADSSVSLGMILVAATPLLATIGKPSARLVFALLFIVAAIASQSRVSAAMVAVGAVYVLWAGKFSVARVVSLLAFIGAALFILNSPLINSLFDRIKDDNDSASLRVEAMDYFVSVWENVFFTGVGAGRGVSLRTGGILESSLENGYIIYAYEFGIIFTVCLLLVQLVLILRRPVIRNFGPGTFMALVVIVNVFSFSSIGASGAMSFVMWFAILCAFSTVAVSELPVLKQQKHVVFTRLDSGQDLHRMK